MKKIFNWAFKRMARYYWSKSEKLNIDQRLGRMFAAELGNFIWEVEAKQDPQKFVRCIEIYGITDVWYDPTLLKVVILTRHPGVLIGVKGATLEEIQYRFRKYAARQGIALEARSCCIKLIEDTESIYDALTQPLVAYNYGMFGL
jgi:RimJ/RimL family protein N-acetyltransferase